MARRFRIIHPSACQYMEVRVEVLVAVLAEVRVEFRVAVLHWLAHGGGDLKGNSDGGCSS